MITHFNKLTQSILRHPTVFKKVKLLFILIRKRALYIVDRQTLRIFRISTFIYKHTFTATVLRIQLIYFSPLYNFHYKKRRVTYSKSQVNISDLARIAWFGYFLLILFQGKYTLRNKTTGVAVSSLICIVICRRCHFHSCVK